MGKRYSHDITYSSLFTHPEMVEELCRDYVKEAWIENVDFSTLEKVNIKFATKDISKRESDVIHKVKYGSKELYIYILLEFESTIIWYMPLKVLNYITLFYLELIKLNKYKKMRLPYVYPIVIYNGEREWKVSTDIADLIDIPLEYEILSEYFIRFSHKLISVNILDKDELAKLKDAVSTLFFVEQSSGAEFEKNIERIIDVIYGLSNKELRQELFIFVSSFIERKNIQNIDLNRYDVSEVIVMLKSAMKEYLEEKKVEGKKERDFEIAKNMLAEGYKIEEIVKITKLSEEEVRNLKE